MLSVGESAHRQEPAKDKAMTEHLNKLRETLGELHDDLEELESLGPETRKLLEEAKADMDAALNPDEDAELEDFSLTDRLNELGRQFDESHPNLSRIVGNLISTLGQMGI